MDHASPKGCKNQCGGHRSLKVRTRSVRFQVRQSRAGDQIRSRSKEGDHVTEMRWLLGILGMSLQCTPLALAWHLFSTALGLGNWWQRIAIVRRRKRSLWPWHCGMTCCFGALDMERQVSIGRHMFFYDLYMWLLLRTRDQEKLCPFKWSHTRISALFQYSIAIELP